MEENRKGRDRGRKTLYINRLEAVFGGHRRRISPPGNWVKPVFLGDLFPTKIATFDQRRSPFFFFNTLHFSASFPSKVKRSLSMTLTRYSGRLTRKWRTLKAIPPWISFHVSGRREKRNRRDWLSPAIIKETLVQSNVVALHVAARNFLFSI